MHRGLNSPFGSTKQITMKVKAENPGIYLKHTKFQYEYMNHHAGTMFDKDIAENIGLSLSQVSYYRTQVLKIENNSGRPTFESYTLQGLQDELAALIAYYAKYNGCMIESLEYRIKDLSVKLGM